MIASKAAIYPPTSANVLLPLYQVKSNFSLHLIQETTSRFSSSSLDYVRSLVASSSQHSYYVNLVEERYALTFSAIA